MDISQVWPEWHEDCVLGEGSFGKVYRAKRVEYGRTFYSAIKVLSVPKSQQEIKHARSQGMDDTAVYQYFHSLIENLLNEITLMDCLKGAQNIVGIEDYKVIERQGEIGWDVFIRMELLTPFDSFVSNPDFSQKDVIKLGIDICSALEACEQNQIVHRDIKPDNIFISKFGEYKLGDFGIARKLETTQANMSRKGTLNYMAPEVYKSQEYGSNVDIYSLGMVLYTLLNNNRIAFLPPYPQPISYKDNEDALSRRLSGEAVPLPCNASYSLGQAIVKACAYNPWERYQTASEFKNALLQEWNVLVQTGDNSGVMPNGQYYAGSDAYANNLTHGMTSEGTVVVSNYGGTTVLNQNMSDVYGYTDQSYSGQGYLPQSVQQPRAERSSKLCRFLAFPLSIVACVLAVLLLTGDEWSELSRIIGHLSICMGVLVLVAGTNRVAMGISLSSLSLTYIMYGLFLLLGQIQETIPVEGVVYLLSGVLMLFGGIVAITQKEIRLSGTMCIYAAVVQWIYVLYHVLNNAVIGGGMDRIMTTAVALLTFAWSYGYDSDAELSGIRKILHFAAYAIAAVAIYSAITLVMTIIPQIF